MGMIMIIIVGKTNNRNTQKENKPNKNACEAYFLVIYSPFSHTCALWPKYAHVTSSFPCNRARRGEQVDSLHK